MNHWRYGVGAGLIAVLAACGGVGDPYPDQFSAEPLTISGTAATGLAIAGGMVSANCTNGLGASTTTQSNGYFSLVLAQSVEGPCILKVESGNTVLYSAVQKGQRTANITPLTHLIVANALADEPANGFAAANSRTVFDALSADNLNQAKTVIAAALSTIGITLPAGQDPLTQSFQAATENTPGDALDQALDQLALTMANAKVSVEQLGTALKTATPANAGAQLQTAAPAGSKISAYTASSDSSVPSTASAVALAGNAYVTQAASAGTESVAYTAPSAADVSGITQWTSPDAVISSYVYIQTPGLLDIGVEGSLESAGSSVIQVRARGKSFNVTLDSTTPQKIPVGVIAVPAAGYIKIDFQGVRKTDSTFAKLTHLHLGNTASANMVYAQTPNPQQGYYWMLRGPTTYLDYRPTTDTAQYLYNEVTIPQGFDAQSSYFNVNGFSAGTFGLQTTADAGRQVVFTVDDPTACDRSASPVDTTQCTSVVGYGAHTTTIPTDAPNTGKRAYLDFPWVAGTTYRFVTRAEVVGGNTLFSAWFYAPENQQWHYLATLQYPGKAMGLTQLYSTDGCLSPEHGYLPRKMLLTNTFTSSDGNTWEEVVNATYSATAEASERWDTAGGVTTSPTGGKRNAFYLIQGGFFGNNGSFNTVAAGQARVPAVPTSYLLRGSVGNVTPESLRAIVPLLVKP